MDNIQKTLVKAGRKDLAQEYYRKVSKQDKAFEKEVLEDNIADLKAIYKAFDVVEKASKKAKYRKLKGSAATFQTSVNDIAKQLTMLPASINSQIKYMERLLKNEYKDI